MLLQIKITRHREYWEYQESPLAFYFIFHLSSFISHTHVLQSAQCDGGACLPFQSDGPEKAACQGILSVQLLCP